MPETRSGYPPNTRFHAVGDLVIHRADAKTNEWIMRVVSYSQDGRVRTEYAFQSDSTRWENPLEALLDPRRPDIRERWRGPAFEDAKKPISPETRQWLDGLREGDPVMQVHDSGNYAPQRFTVYSVSETLIRVERLSTMRRYRRRDGREEGGFAWHIEPVNDSEVTK